jgi:hypothetical protein
MFPEQDPASVSPPTGLYIFDFGELPLAVRPWRVEVTQNAVFMALGLSGLDCRRCDNSRIAGGRGKQLPVTTVSVRWIWRN